MDVSLLLKDEISVILLWIGLYGLFDQLIHLTLLHDKKKYIYLLPLSTFGEPDLFEADSSFKNLVESQLEAIKNQNSPSMSPETTDGFFGGIYDYFFPKK